MPRYTKLPKVISVDTKRKYKKKRSIAPTVKQYIAKAIAKSVPNKYYHIDSVIANEFIDLSTCSNASWSQVIRGIQNIGFGDAINERAANNILIRAVTFKMCISMDSAYPNARLRVLTLLQEDNSVPTGAGALETDLQFLEPLHSRLPKFSELECIKKYGDKIYTVNPVSQAYNSTTSTMDYEHKLLNIVIKRYYKKGLKINYATDGAGVEPSKIINIFMMTDNVNAGVFTCVTGSLDIVFEDA